MPTRIPAAIGARDSSHVIAELLAWFELEGTDWPWRRTRDRWHVLVSELCLQQTQAPRAATFVVRILDRFPTAASLAAAPLGELLALWQGLGYPRRARNLHLSAAIITESGWPQDLTDLPGVGPYTADAIRCFADGEAVVPTDINTRRVVERLFCGAAPQPDEEPALAAHAWTWGQALMELGQVACRAKARCNACPVSDHCPSRGTTDVIASARQSRFEGSFRQRRGKLMAQLTSHGAASALDDPEAAASLVADGLATRSDDGFRLLI